MIVAKVVGNIWATRKEESLQGMKLMVVQPVDVMTDSVRDCFVAVDQVGSGIGEMVLVSTGSSARLVRMGQHSPIDAIIVGIVDQMDVSGGRE